VLDFVAQRHGLSRRGEGDKVEEVEGVPFSLNVRGNIANVANFGSQARHCEHWEHSVPFKNAAAWTS